MPQRVVKTLAVRPDNLSAMPGDHFGEGKNRLPRFSFDLHSCECALTHVHMNTYTYAHQINITNKSDRTFASPRENYGGATYELDLEG